jgi:hypothetical protein
MKFRKKPVIIEAELFDGTTKSADKIIDWVGNGCDSAWQNPHMLVVRIPTMEGTMTASLGDWIIKGVKNEFYPCKPDIFAQIYEPV